MTGASGQPDLRKHLENAATLGAASSCAVHRGCGTAAQDPGVTACISRLFAPVHRLWPTHKSSQASGHLAQLEVITCRTRPARCGAPMLVKSLRVVEPREGSIAGRRQQ